MSERGILSRPPGVALMGWLVPGMGYVLLGQRARGITVGITVLFIFAMGILIGGIRVMDPPGWGQFGYRPQLVVQSKQPSAGMQRTAQSFQSREDPGSADDEQKLIANTRGHFEDANTQVRTIGWVLSEQPFSEVLNKPWCIGQILTGPISLVLADLSVHAARPIDSAPAAKPVEHIAASHARSWELGTLYTAIAGMLNLLALIDSSFRAGQQDQQ